MSIANLRKHTPKFVFSAYGHLLDLFFMALFQSYAYHEKHKLELARNQYASDYNEIESPLVSITIATYNRADILIERTLPTVFNQSYQNFEIIIVGDHCTDETETRIREISDPRIRFINLPERGKYPEKNKHRWMVAGSVPINRALQEAKGLWIAHLDDDDCYLPQHLETMLHFAQTQNVEMVYSKMRKEFTPGDWQLLGEPLPVARRRQRGVVPHSTVFFRSYLRLFKFDLNSWRYSMAVDKHIWLRMDLASVRMAFLDQVTVESPLRPNTTKAHELAEDRD